MTCIVKRSNIWSILKMLNHYDHLHITFWFLLLLANITNKNRIFNKFSPKFWKALCDMSTSIKMFLITYAPSEKIHTSNATETKYGGWKAHLQEPISSSSSSTTSFPPFFVVISIKTTPACSSSCAHVIYRQFMTINQF